MGDCSASFAVGPASTRFPRLAIPSTECRERCAGAIDERTPNQMSMVRPAGRCVGSLNKEYKYAKEPSCLMGLCFEVFEVPKQRILTGGGYVWVVA